MKTAKPSPVARSNLLLAQWSRSVGELVDACDGDGFEGALCQALRRLVAGGALLRPFPQDVIEAALKNANDLYAELSAKSADFKRVHEALKTFRNEEYLWFQVAEYTYDNFMIRARARG